MFHRYVVTAARRSVDIDRATFLMDKDLLADALSARDHEREHCPRPDADYGAQWVWDYYSERHAEKYGQPFEPDVSPDWA